MGITEEEESFIVTYIGRIPCIVMSVLLLELY